MVVEVKASATAGAAALLQRLSPAQRERLGRAIAWLRRTPAGSRRTVRADLALVRGRGRRTRVQVIEDVLAE